MRTALQKHHLQSSQTDKQVLPIYRAIYSTINVNGLNKYCTVKNTPIIHSISIPILRHKEL